MNEKEPRLFFKKKILKLSLNTKSFNFHSTECKFHQFNAKYLSTGDNHNRNSLINVIKASDCNFDWFHRTNPYLPNWNSSHMDIFWEFNIKMQPFAWWCWWWLSNIIYLYICTVNVKFQSSGGGGRGSVAKQHTLRGRK